MLIGVLYNVVLKIPPLENCLQAKWRGHRDRSYYKKLKRASIVTQCRWRGRIARRELRKLKMVCTHFCLQVDLMLEANEGMISVAASISRFQLVVFSYIFN